MHSLTVACPIAYGTALDETTDTRMKPANAALASFGTTIFETMSLLAGEGYPVHFGWLNAV